MRILQLHNHHKSLGGAMEVLAHEAALLSSAGHAVSAYTLPPADESGLGPVRAGAKAIWNLEACRDVEDRIRSFRPDVVHVHTPFPLLSPAPFRTARAMGVPSVATLHSYRYSCIAATCHRDGAPCEDCVGKRLKLPGLRHRCYHDSLGASAALTLSLAVHRGLGTFHRCVDRFLALTDFSRGLLIRDGVPADKVVVKPNSVTDPGLPDRRELNERYIAFAGRLMDIKGVETMLAAWQMPGHDGLRLKIAGDGPQRDLVEEHSRRDPSVDYLGWVGENDVYDVMAGAEAVLVPSEWYEGGGPLAAVRSLAVGTPLIVSDLENICAPVLADDAGVTFETGSPTSLAQVLQRVDHDPQFWQARRRQARRSYELRYDPAVDLPRLEKVYRELLTPGQ